MSLWRRECSLASLSDDADSLAAALADNLAAQASVEREAMQLRAEELAIRARIQACASGSEAASPVTDAAATPKPEPKPGRRPGSASEPDALVPDGAANPLTLVCASCSRTGKDHFSAAQRKKPSATRRCKRCVEASAATAAPAAPQVATDERREARRKELQELVAAAKQFAPSDPRGLAAWSSLALAETAEGASALVECFDAALAPNARRVLASNCALVAEMPEWVQWQVSCGRLVRAHDAARGQLCRFVLQPARHAAAESFGVGDLLIDVLGEALVASPALLGGGEGGGGGGGGPSPLLLVRYLHARAKGEAFARQAEAFLGTPPGRCAVLDAARRASGGAPAEPTELHSRWLRAQGDEEVEVALACLREHEARLAPAYRAHFYAASPWHLEAEASGGGGARGFRCSFLVPPVPKQAPRSTRL